MFGRFGMSGAVSMRAGHAGNAFWACVSASAVCLGGVLGPSWGVWGGSWRFFGGSRKFTGRLLGAFLEDFLPS